MNQTSDWQRPMRDAAASIFGCTPQDVRIEVGVEEVDGQPYNFAEAYFSRRQGRVGRGQRDGERIVRTPFLSAYGGIPHGENRAVAALSEALAAEAAKKKGHGT
jgi:hypothetical protein